MGGRLSTGKPPGHRSRHPGRLSLSHPSLGRQNEYWLWLRPTLGKNGESCITVDPVTRTAGILAYSGFEMLYRSYTILTGVKPRLLKASQSTLAVSRTCAVLDLCRRRTTSLEQSAAQSLTMWAVIRPVQVVTEDIFIRTVRQRRSVNCFTCAE